MTPTEIVQLAASLSLLAAGLCAVVVWALRPGSRGEAWMNAHDPAVAW